MVYSKRYELDLKSAFYLSKSDESNPRPGDPGLILARMVLPIYTFTDMKKYVVLQTYSDKDYVSTIDVVGGLRGGSHRKIAEEYLENFLADKIGRYDIAGGFVNGGGTWVEFCGGSGEFSNRFSRFSEYSVNDISAYLAMESGLFEIVDSIYIDKGREYIERCLINKAEGISREMIIERIVGEIEKKVEAALKKQRKQ